MSLYISASSPKEYNILLCERKDIKEFIEKNHYSGSINGLHISYCFKLMHNDICVGAMIYGSIGMRGVWKKYANNKEDLIELRRLCCIDDTPKNTESFFIGKTLKWLHKNTSIKLVISYADLSYGHTGIIYKASNFKKVGKTIPGKAIIFNNKLYHDKTIRTKYKGKLKPYAQKVKDALENGEAHYKKMLSKNIYVYEFNNDTRKNENVYGKN